MRSALRFVSRKVVAPYSRRPQMNTSTATTSSLSLSRRHFTSITDVSSLPKPGESIQGFTLQEVKHVPELELTALHFRHDKTDAEYLHVARDDTNNAFSIGFKTNPPDATGVPHILEHVTLCASEKYPIRDPFFKMLPRSLNNFMNAFTTTDHTMYPISTTNKTDFRNLMTMYLDATLHPLLKQSDFRQEGWRIGPENLNDESGALEFKGVVYNEMKGQFSDTTYLYYMRWLQEVFPSLNFYGGDPQFITDLTWQDLTKFHHDHYHPSNSKIITYGDTPCEEHLTILDSELSRFTKRTDFDKDLKRPTELNEAKEVVVQGPLDTMLPEDAQNKISLTWTMGDTKNLQETFALRIATTLLLDGYGSPMYQALVESGLGTDYTANTGFDTSSAQGIFALGLNGVSDENLKRVPAAIHDTIKTVISSGFEDQKVQGLLHQLEIGLKHKNATFGLDVINSLTPGWFNGIKPLDILSWNVVVNTFKQNYAQKGYLESLLQKYLSSDKHLTFVMQPTSDYSTKLSEAEAERLKQKIAKAGPEAAKQFSAQEQDLLREQESGREQSLDCLPTLRVTDIPRQQKDVETTISELTTSQSRSIPVQWREANTNGLTYFKAIALLELDDQLRPLVPLFCDTLLRLGTKTKSVNEMEDLIKLKTGGVSFVYHSTTSPDDIFKAEEGLTLSSSALDVNITAMYEIVSTLLVETDFSSTRARTMIRQLLQASASGAIDAVAESGHAEAWKYAEASLTPHNSMVEQTSGLSQVEIVSRLAQLDESSTEMDLLIKQLLRLQAKTVEALSTKSRVAITHGTGSRSSNEQALSKFFSSLSSLSQPSSSSSLLTGLRTARTGKTLFDLPFQVYYSALSLETFPYIDERGAPLAVLAKLLTHKHLHHEIREKGGAYGAGAYSRGLGGVWGMYSYRDPNPENTLNVMQNAGRWAAERSWSDADLEEAKLSLFQALDAPQSVNDEGMLKFTNGIDSVMDQKRRELLLDVNKDQIRTAAEWVTQQISDKKENLVVLGRKAAWSGSEWKNEELKRSRASGS